MKVKAHGIHGSDLIPRPANREPACTPGLSPDRVLLLGNGALAGWGVTSQDQAIPGHLARELTARTGHGAEIHLRMDHTVTGETITDLTRDFDFAEFDAIVVVVGASDALQLLAPTRWDNAVHELIADLDARLPVPTDVVIMGIQAPSSVPVFRVTPGGLVDELALTFNALTRSHCTGRVSFLAPPALARVGPSSSDPHGSAEQQRVSAGYRAWAVTIADRLRDLRLANRSWGA